MGPILALNVQDVAEAGGGDKGGFGAAALQYGVGGHGSAVDQQFYGAPGGAGALDDLANALDQGSARVVGGAIYFVKE